MMGSNTTISTRRLSGGTYSPNLSGISAYIEPASAEIGAIFETNAKEVYTMFVDGDVDIVAHDEVTDASGDIYEVSQRRAYVGNTDVPNHSEFIIARTYAKSNN